MNDKVRRTLAHKLTPTEGHAHAREIRAGMRASMGAQIHRSQKHVRTHASSQSEALPSIAEARQAGDPAKLVGPFANP